VIEPVRKTVTVRASQEHAFRVFTEGFDTWWPREHHIGKSPMRKAVIEGYVGGRMFSEQEDGSECAWGSVTVWDPPHRFVFAWLINAEWQFDPDVAKTSEIEVRFVPERDGTVRVELEHRNFERMGEGGATMRTGVDAERGWSFLMQLYRDCVDAVPA
jgi:hypothetical protein